METEEVSEVSDTITCEELDRRQYENDLEMLRIELESKKATLVRIEAEHLEQLEQVEERALEAERLAKVMQLKWAETQQQQQSGTNSNRNSNYKNELREIAQRQKLLEATNRQLAMEAAALTDGLSDLRFLSFSRFHHEPFLTNFVFNIC